DAVALAELRWSWQVGVGREPAMAREEFTTAFERWFGDHRDTHVAFLAEADGAAVGMAWLALIDRVPGPAVWHRLAGSLQSVFVEPSHRDRGLGAALTAAVIDEGVARRLDYLIVHPSQRSFPLYRRLGFRESGGVLELDLRDRHQPS
ncbi:MAG TPA: GNAT family N-acetyltransferase, partial [Acidimicrobiales bacterium]|nr:GNAT family N-acetyltransferase [Acidimicrobiales bacterium]